MRGLIKLARPEDNERGVAGVIVAVMMVVLIGAGAVAVDVGQIYVERAQLQNGADAGALAVARSCQAGSCDAALADPLANSNSNDGASAVNAVDVAGTQVTVTTTTKNGSSSFLSNMFSNALGADPVSVGAKSTAAWGSPGSGPAVLPLAFASCEILTDGSTHTITTHGTTTCTSDSPSGSVIPGGFHWLASDVGKCQATVHADDPLTSLIVDPYAKSDPGASLSTLCKAVIEDLLNEIVLFPIFTAASAGGAGGKYYIKGYVAMRLLGYRFPGSSEGDTTGLAPPKTGVRGQFVEFVADPTTYTGGGYSDGGVSLPPHLIK